MDLLLPYKDYRRLQVMDEMAKAKQSGFITHMGKDYVELSPTKGSLYKFRHYGGFWRVFYGTIYQAYCSDLSSCFKFVNQR